MQNKPPLKTHHQTPKRRPALAKALLAMLLGSLSGEAVHCEDWMYRIRPGDNLWTFSETYLNDASLWRRVQELNHIADAWNIPPGTVLCVPAQWLKKFPAAARVVHVQGNAHVLDHATRSWSAVSVGSLLAKGDEIQTDENGSVTVEFTDGSQLILQPGGTLKLNSLGRFGDTGMTDTRLHLESGRLQTKVTPRKGTATRFEIAAPAAVTSARGTDYRLVPAGYGTVVAEGRPPNPPIELAPPPNLDELPEVFDRVPIQFQLPPLAGATGYRAQIAAGEGFDKLLFDWHYTGQIAQGPV